VSDRTNANFLQVLLRKARKDPLVYLVVSECRLISFEAQAPQPNRDVHGGVLTLPGEHDRRDEAPCPAPRTYSNVSDGSRRFDRASPTSGLPPTSDMSLHRIRRHDVP